MFFMARPRKSQTRRVDVNDPLFQEKLIRCHVNHQIKSICYGQAKSYQHFRLNYPNLCKQFCYEEIVTLLKRMCPNARHNVEEQHNIAYLDKNRKQRYFNNLRVEDGPVIIVDRDGSHEFWVAVLIYDSVPVQCVVRTSESANPREFLAAFTNTEYDLFNSNMWRNRRDPERVDWSLRVLMDSNPETLLSHIEETEDLCARRGAQFLQHPFGLRSKWQCFIERYVNQVKNVKSRNPEYSDLRIQEIITSSFPQPPPIAE